MQSNHFVSSSYLGKYSQSYILLIFLVIFSIIHASVFSSKLPDNCACHFSFTGEPDGNCSKGGLIASYLGVVCGLTVMLVGIANILSKCKSQFNVPHREIWMSPTFEEFTVSYTTNYMILLAGLVDVFLIYVFNTLFLYNYKCISNDDNEIKTTTTDINPTKENCDYQIDIITILIIFVIYMFFYVSIPIVRFFIKPYMNDDQFIDSNLTIMRDEDYCCLWCYCNPRDTRIFVPKRLGIGITLNMGRVSYLVFVAYMFTIIIFIIGIVETLCTLL